MRFVQALLLSAVAAQSDIMTPELESEWLEVQESVLAAPVEEVQLAEMDELVKYSDFVNKDIN